MDTVPNTRTLSNPGAWLLAEVTRRQQRNPNFSLRAMANMLRVSPGCLSELISGRRTFTAKMALKFADQLNLSPDEKLELLTSAQKAKTKATDHPGAKGATKVDVSHLEVDRFRAISDWYHHAILSLCRVKDAEATPEWIADRLGISAREAADGMDRLRRLGMLAIENGRMSQATPNHEVQTPVPAPAIRKFHAQTLQKAEESLHRDALHERHFSTLTVAVNLKQLPKAKSLIDKFVWDMDKVLEQSGTTNDRVYSLAVQLFPIDTHSISSTSPSNDAEDSRS